MMEVLWCLCGIPTLIIIRREQQEVEAWTNVKAAVTIFCSLVAGPIGLALAGLLGPLGRMEVVKVIVDISQRPGP